MKLLVLHIIYYQLLNYMSEEKKPEVSTGVTNIMSSYWKHPEHRRNILRILGIVLLILIILPKILPVIIEYNPFKTTPEPILTMADAVVIYPQSLENRLFSTGNVLAIQEINLSAEASGVITRLNMQEGAEVRRGQLLVKINDNNLVPQLSQTKYALELMEQNAARQQTLFERGGSSQEEFDTIQIELNKLKTEVEILEAQIRRTEIRAPFDGILGLKYVDIGAYITPTTRIATLQDLSNMVVDFAVPERYAQQVRIGNEIRFTVQGTDSVFTARVYAQEPQVDTRTRTIQVRAATTNEGRLLRPGAFATIDLVLDESDTALIVPSIALIPDMGAYKVYKYDNGTVVSVPVDIGSRTPTGVQIINGIAAGDTILVSGLLQVQDGMPVQLSSIISNQ